MIDNLDRKLIVELQKNSRVSYMKLARITGVSFTTIYRRVKRLLQKGLIKIVAVPDVNALGYKMAFITLEVDVGKIDAICTKLMDKRMVHFLASTYGRFNVLVVVHLFSYDDLMKFIKDEFSNLDGVTRIEIFFVAELKKRSLDWVTYNEPDEHNNRGVRNRKRAAGLNSPQRTPLSE